jgi:molecular chaperone GrpE
MSDDTDGDSEHTDAAPPDIDETALATDASVEEILDRAAAADLDDSVRALVERVADLEADYEDLADEMNTLETQLKRKQADYENYKKRAKREQERIKEHATAELIERLLDVRDNLTRALDEEDSDVETLREGVRMTLSEFDRVLDGEDVTEITPAPGDRVDPERHEVLMRVESDHPEGTVADVHRSGYEMAGEILREAQVTVSDDE